MMTANQIATRLAAQAAAVAKHLLPNGKRLGNDWCVGSLQGEPGKSLRISIAGNKKGVWADFASNQAGDLLTLWSLVRGLSIAQAMREAKEYLGITTQKVSAHKLKTQIEPITKHITPLRKNSAVAAYLQEQRKIIFEICQQFQIGESEDRIVLPYLLEEKILQIKYLSIHRENNKKAIFVEPKGGQPCLFGWQAFPDDAREVTLTEGEIDAMSLAQYGIPALSLPFGGGNGGKHKWLDFEFDHLSLFDKIYLCFDNDEVGRQTADALVDRLGRHRCFIVTLPHKDANECLQQNISDEEIRQCFEEAASFDPKKTKCVSTYDIEVSNLFKNKNDPLNQGYLLPWKLAQDFFQFRPKELSVFTGINGHGKSQFLGFLLLHAMHQGAKVCIASFELEPVDLLKRLTIQATACESPQPELVEAAQNFLKGKLWIYDEVGMANIDELLEDFELVHLRDGVDVFLIDSLVKCSIPEDDFNGQHNTSRSFALSDANIPATLS